jgi:hypothetical protein
MNPGRPPPPLAPSLPQAPMPPVGSPRYFALLYSPSALRARLRTLLGLADEIGAGGARGLDPGVAQVRLEWWRAEAGRCARGEPQHPWLRALCAAPPAGCPLDLQPLVEAAAEDLSNRTLSARPGAALQGAVFEQCAALLDRDAAAASPCAPWRGRLRELGSCALELERVGAGQAPSGPAAAAAGAAPGAPLEALRARVREIDAATQPRLAPLLVWIALAARQAQRRAHRPDGHRGFGLEAFADNMLAWNAARRAARGRFRID